MRNGNSNRMKVNSHFTLVLAWRRHVQHVRVLFVDEEESAIVDSAQSDQQVTNLCDWIDRCIVTVRGWIGKLLEEIFVILFLKQHDHVFE